MLQKHYSGSEEYGKAAKALYPYAYARVAAMRSALIKKGEYHKLAKMGPNEIASYLESTQYKKEIDLLAVSHKGPELLEVAINKNVSETFRKLRRIAGPRLQALIDIYLKRKDIENIKTIIRAKYTGTEEKQIINMLQPAQLSIDQLKALLKKQTIEEVLREARITRPETWKQANERFKETNNLAEIENALDQSYYTEVLEAASKLPTRGTEFKQFLQHEIATKNIINILRFVKEGLDKKAIHKLLIKMNGKTDKTTARMMETEPITAFESSKYGATAKKGIEAYRQKNTTAQIESDLEKYLLAKALAMAKYKPLIADSIIGYMFAKEIEAKNLKLIAKAKQLGMSEEFIQEHITA
ncbi:V-type ATPase subunit [Candidatus Woesearchaeota archaeon]|nr:V-type ATPase subunit [Candidatus Woesearchaeota archaeon]